MCPNLLRVDSSANTNNSKGLITTDSQILGEAKGWMFRPWSRNFHPQQRWICRKVLTKCVTGWSVLRVHVSLAEISPTSNCIRNYVYGWEVSAKYYMIQIPWILMSIAKRVHWRRWSHHEYKNAHNYTTSHNSTALHIFPTSQTLLL